MAIKFKLAPAKHLSGVAAHIVNTLVGGCEDEASQQEIQEVAEKAHSDLESAKVQEARADVAKRLGTDADSEEIDTAVKRLQKATVKAKAMRLAMLAMVNGVAPVEQARKLMNVALASDVLMELEAAARALGERVSDYICPTSTRTKSGFGKTKAAPGYILALWDLNQTIEICKKAQAQVSKNSAKAAA